jgi:hypothetical protein
MTSHFTVVIKPIPRGINRDDLVSNHLLPFGQIKQVRFGEGRGAAGDVMYVDYFDAVSALAAVDGLNGKRDPGTSHLVLSVSLTRTSAEAVEKHISREKEALARKKTNADITKKPVQPKQVESNVVRPKDGFRYLKSRDTGREICLLDFKIVDS